MGERRVAVAVLNDYAVVVAGVAGLLRPYEDRIEVVELASGVPVEQPVDLVLYDSFGQHQGTALVVDDLVPHPECRLVVYSWNQAPSVVRASLEAGAAGYLSKGLDGDALADALLRIAKGEVVTPDSLPADSRDEFIPGRWPGHEAGLSAREAEILALLCQGLSNDDIAERAYLSTSTVRTYLRTLFSKLDVQSRTQAVLWGVEHGFRPDERRKT